MVAIAPFDVVKFLRRRNITSTNANSTLTMMMIVCLCAVIQNSSLFLYNERLTGTEKLSWFLAGSFFFAAREEGGGSLNSTKTRYKRWYMPLK